MADRVRVLVVDDTPDLRVVVCMLLELDGRFEVVGEAGDGIEGIARAAELQPDAILLDRSMPRMSGLEALPELRTVAPHAAIVLYTAEDDEGVRQAALASGAVGVMEKGYDVGQLAVHLSDALVREWSDPAAGLTVRVGPVPSDGAVEWIRNTRRILSAVRDDPTLTEVPVDVAVIALFERYLDAWLGIAERGPEFVWAAAAAPADVHRLVEAWAIIDRIPEDRLAAAGLAWSTDRGRQFFEALTGAVLDALVHHDATVELARNLQSQWG
jgi:CheY-like chemotaxis protein